MRADGLLLDLDGTLYVEDAALPGAIDAVRRLAERGVPRRYLTNTTRRSRRALGARLREYGFAVDDDEIFTAPRAAARWLGAHGLRRIALYLPEATVEDFTGLDIVDSEPDAVVVGDLGDAWGFDTLNRAFRQLVGGARLVALQKNRYWRAAGGLMLDAGPFVAALEYAAATEAIVIGKPSAEFFHLAVASLGVARERVAVVGDDVESDVGGAQAAGLRGVLVRTGKFREERLCASGVEPDAVLESIADVERLL